MKKKSKLKQALKYLSKKDAELARIIKLINLKPLKPRDNHFQSLVEAIISQQLSSKAADTIIGRFKELLPKKDFPSPAEILQIKPARLRKAGLSGQKVRYITGLAKAVIRGDLDFNGLARMPDEQVIEELIKIKGIGRWTAEMFLIFSLRRPDVFSFGDLGSRNALIKIYGRRGRLTPAAMARIVARWSPHRSHAARVLWASLSLE